MNGPRKGTQRTVLQPPSNCEVTVTVRYDKPDGTGEPTRTVLVEEGAPIVLEGLTPGQTYLISTVGVRLAEDEPAPYFDAADEEA